MSLMLVLLPSDASRSYIDPRCVIDISYESAGNEMLNACYHCNVGTMHGVHL